MAQAIFINYRRSDAAAVAGRLYDRLSAQFGRRAVFMDVDAIPAGADFVAVLDQTVGRCAVLLAIIGPRWLEARGGDGRRRIDDASDFVRIEIASALRRGVTVIPVLVDGAEMPPAAMLPPDVRGLTRRNAVRLRHDRFGDDANRLIGAVKRALRGRDKVGTAIRWVAGAVVIAGLIAGVAAYLLAVPERKVAEKRPSMTSDASVKPDTGHTTRPPSPPVVTTPAPPVVTPHDVPKLNWRRATSGRAGRIMGSSSIMPYARKVAARMSARTGLRAPEVGSGGTSAGIKLLCSGESDVAMSVREIKTSELADCTANSIRELYEVKVGTGIDDASGGIAHFYLYIPRHNPTVVPGLTEFVEEFLSDSAAGYLDDNGFDPLTRGEREDMVGKLNRGDVVRL